MLKVGTTYRHYYRYGLSGETIPYEVFDEASGSFDSGDMIERSDEIGTYYVDWTPDAAGIWMIEATLNNDKPAWLYPVALGVEQDIYNIVKSGGTGDNAAILADTNELQGDWKDGGRLDLLLDAALADTAELQTDWADGGRLDLLLDAALADTAELQTDWADGGRLDLILDTLALEATLATVNGVVDDILVDTGTTIPATLVTIYDLLNTELADVLTDTGTTLPALLATIFGSEFDGTPNLYDVLVTGYTTAASYVPSGSMLERLELLQTILALDNIIYTADSATVNTITDSALTGTAELYEGMIVIPLSGVMVGQGRVISSYDETNKILTVVPDWAASPSTAYYVIKPAGEAHYLMQAGKGLESIFDTVDGIPVKSRVADSLTADGSKQTVFTIDAPGGIIQPTTTKISLENMEAGDSVTITEEYRLEDGGDYLIEDTKPYTGVQTRKSIKIKHTENLWGYKVTLDQTAGTNRVYPWEHYYEG